MKKKTDWLALSPLLLLFLLPLTPVVGKAGSSGMHSVVQQGINGIRYFALPLIGFSLGFTLFLALTRGHFEGLYVAARKFAERREKEVIICFGAAFLVLFSVMPLLRYFTLNSGAFDFGLYDNKIWLISALQGFEKLKQTMFGHFQPVLLLYASIYDLGLSPSLLQLTQAATVTAGSIPLYLMAKERLKSPLLVAGVVVLYFLYPPTQFNAALDFHPDHLFIPLMLWALYFIETERLALSLPFIIVSATVKEPLLLSIAFWGPYLVWQKKRYVSGSMLFVASFAAFYCFLFIAIPYATGWTSGEHTTKSGGFGYLFAGNGALEILKEVFSPGKLRFPFFALLPLLFLPLIRPLEFLPALPAIGIALLSANINHQTVSSQYTASIIPSAFLALIYAVGHLRDRFGERVIFGLFSWIFVLTLFMNIAHSPTPAAVAFWDKNWSNGNWHFSKYVRTGHEKTLEETLEHVPADPEARVVSHSMVYHYKLGHRFFFNPFPDYWQKADYILVDNTRGPYILDNLDEQGYLKKIKELREDPALVVVFEKDGIVLFNRLKQNKEIL